MPLIPRKNKKSGFTLIEILVVLAIVGLISIFIFTSLNNYKKFQALDKDKETIVQILRQARSQTLSSRNASQYGAHIASSTVTLFTGTTYSSSSASNQVFLLQASDNIMTISLNGGGSDVVFTRLTGETNQYGTITISSPTTSKTKTVTIYKTGLVEAN